MTKKMTLYYIADDREGFFDGVLYASFNKKEVEEFRDEYNRVNYVYFYKIYETEVEVPVIVIEK